MILHRCPPTPHLPPHRPRHRRLHAGYIYDGSEGPFEKLPNSYRCPVCSSPKRRFKPYAGAASGGAKNDQRSMDARAAKMQAGEGLAAGGASSDGGSGGLVVGAVAGAAILVALYVFLSAQYN